MEVDLWSGDWGLPSVDYRSLQILAYARFSGVPLKQNPTNNPFWSLSGTLPVFRQGFKTRITRFHDVVHFLRQQNYSADFNLSKKDAADVSAYSSMLERKLEPALLYLWWFDERNYMKLTRPWYAKRLPFPTNYLVPGQMQRKAEEVLKAQFGDVDNSLLETAVFSEAQKCITLLAERLKDQEFFFGKSPTSFDAMVFSFLAPLLKVPFPSSKHLQNHLKACDNLVRFVGRVLQKYFPLTIQDNRTGTPSANPDPLNQLDFPHKWRDIIFSGLFAFTAMFGYAFLVGIITVEPDDDQLPTDNYESVPRIPEHIFEGTDSQEDEEQQDNF